MIDWLKYIMFKTNWMDNLTLILSESTWLLIPKKPTLLFEKSTGRRPGWCGQPLRVVGLGRDGTLHGTYEFCSCLFPLGRPVSRKACKKQKTKKTSIIVINDCFNPLNPNIKIQILICYPYTFSIEEVGRICWSIN